MFSADAVQTGTDEYFNKSRTIVSKFGDVRATYACFLRSPIVVAPRLAIEFLKANYPADAAWPLEIELKAKEGTLLAPKQPIMFISGSMAALLPLETGFLQLLGPACVIARNVFETAMSRPDTTFIAMDGRHCAGESMQAIAGYAAAVGSETARLMGAKGFVGSSSALANAYFGKTKGSGTMPHALIGYFKARLLAAGGSDAEASAQATLEAAKAYVETFPEEKVVTVLVDYEGREISDSLAVAKWFHEAGFDKAGKTLAFRLDTHGGRFLEGLDWEKSIAALANWTRLNGEGAIFEKAVSTFRFGDKADAREVKDRYLFGTGVTAAAVVAFRQALDRAGYTKAQIVGSSGFNPTKCRVFANLEVPVNVIGTGSFLPDTWSDTYATADIVRYEVDGKPFDLVKVGRESLKLA